MPSQLIKNDAVSFVVTKTFRYGDTDYEIGDDFPKDVTNKIETLVRTRFVAPVIDHIDDKPRHWHREVRLREDVMSHLNKSVVQLVMSDGKDDGQPELPFEEERVNVTDETRGEFDPADHTVAEVKEYLEAHPEDTDRVDELRGQWSWSQRSGGGVMNSAFGIDHGYDEIEKASLAGFGRVLSESTSKLGRGLSRSGVKNQQGGIRSAFNQTSTAKQVPGVARAMGGRAQVGLGGQLRKLGAGMKKNPGLTGGLAVGGGAAGVGGAAGMFANRRRY
jgi:hypothetical protein